MRYPKTLLFVNNHQSQILELHIGLQQAVRPNNDIHTTQYQA